VSALYFVISLKRLLNGVNWELGFIFFEGWELGFLYWDWDKYFEIWIGIVFFYPLSNPIRAQINV